MITMLAELDALVNHIKSKLPNFNLEENISLKNEQVKALLAVDRETLTILLSTEADFSNTNGLNKTGLNRINQILLLQQKILEKHEYASVLLRQLNEAFDNEDEVVINSLYRDFLNHGLSWFSADCFKENEFAVLNKVKFMKGTQAINYDPISVNHQLRTKTQSKNKVAIIGAGPTGLMAAFKLYESGARVNLIEARSGTQLHTRKQVVVLDPTIMAELRHYLGTDGFNTLFRKGRLFPDGRGSLVISDLEKTLLSRLEEIAAVNGDHLQIHTGMRANTILPPKNESESFKIGMLGSSVSFDCDYIYCAEGGRNNFSNPRYLLKTPEQAKVNADATPNAFVTLIYDIKEDKGLPGFHTEGQAPYISKIKDEFQPTREQIDLFIDNYKRLALAQINELLKLIKNTELASDLSVAHTQFVNCDFQLKLNDGDTNLRTFEVRDEFYIASRVPMEFEKLIRLLNQVTKDSASPEKAKTLSQNIHDTLMTEFSLLMHSKFPFLKDKRVQFDLKSSQSFLVTPQGTSLAARVLTYNKQELMLLAGGDLFRSPHFYSGSGLSSAHAEINAFVEYFESIQLRPTFLNSIRAYFLAQMQHVADFVDAKMAEYCKVHKPILTPLSIDIEEVGSEAIKIEQLIEKIRYHRSKLQQSLSSFRLLRWLFQSLQEDKLAVLDQLLTRLDKEPTYAKCKEAVADVFTEDKRQILQSHRYAFWSTKQTTSTQLVDNLIRDLKVVSEGEQIHHDTTDYVSI